MFTILVVDDSQTARRLTLALLSREPEWRSCEARDGREALELLGRQKVDAIVTDLQMPEIDGLELVRTVGERHPTIPCILMTGEGSEEIAVQALQAGAASYVPKRLLSQQLCETLRSVIAAAQQSWHEEELQRCQMSCSFRWTLPSEFSLIPVLIRNVQQAVHAMEVCRTSELTRFSVALEEALANAFYHGNLEVDPNLRKDSYSHYQEIARERASQEPYCHRRTHVTVEVDRSRAVCKIRDEGRGFDPSTLPDPTDSSSLDSPGGRGVLLMRTFMDEVRYNETGNEVTLVKRKSLARPPSSSVAATASAG